jgi:hypothetical protein
MFIITVSIILFHYWFRYTSLLILSTRAAKDYTREVATANRLTFLDVRNHLQDSGSEALLHHEKSLERDFRLINYLLNHSASVELAGDRLEHLILKADFHLMKMWFRVYRAHSEERARMSVREMSQIVAHYANSLGERLAVANATRF